MKKLLLMLVLAMVPTIADAQIYPSSNVQGTTPQNQALTNVPPVYVGCQAIATGSPPTASSTHNGVSLMCDITGATYVRLGSSQPFRCALNALGTTLTQCGSTAVNPYHIYVTDITVISTTATGAGFAAEFGTGTNCGTGTTFLYPFAAAIASWTVPANTGNAEQFHFTEPIEVTVANGELCAVGTSATNTLAIEFDGFLAP